MFHCPLCKHRDVTLVSFHANLRSDDRSRDAAVCTYKLFIPIVVLSRNSSVDSTLASGPGGPKIPKIKRPVGESNPVRQARRRAYYPLSYFGWELQWVEIAYMCKPPHRVIRHWNAGSPGTRRAWRHDVYKAGNEHVFRLTVCLRRLHMLFCGVIGMIE